MKSYDIVIVGGGPAGLAAAVAAYDNGINNLLILERDEQLTARKTPSAKRFAGFFYCEKLRVRGGRAVGLAKVVRGGNYLAVFHYNSTYRHLTLLESEFCLIKCFFHIKLVVYHSTK